jgi:hypothetical protein
MEAHLLESQYAKNKGPHKIHKEGSSIKPVVNWKNAPAYKLARTLVRKLQKHIPVPYAFNIKNTTQLINDLKEIPFDQNLRFISFDISNMYTNIHTDELLTIIELACENNIVENGKKHDIIKPIKVVADENYFQFMGQT